MIYKDFQQLKLSALGMGMMRLPVLGGDDSHIDETETERMIKYAVEHGINYFDTAYGYHNGHSEEAAGKILSKYKRDSFYLADKFPGYDLSNMDKVEEIFEEQLLRCNVEYFDFYLFHNVCEMNIEQYLNSDYHIFEYLIKQRENGRIKHLGFSCHGKFGTLCRFLDAYGSDMEFCQLQLNYIDWKFQDCEAKVKLLNDRNIPIWVMEPLRGGKLANLPEPYGTKLKTLRPFEDPKAIAFRFLQTVPGIKMVLSGMSSYDQMKENISIWNEDKPLTDSEFDEVLKIADSMTASVGVPCTGCHYCTSHCTKQLDIPELIKLYNEDKFTGGGFLAPMTIGNMPDEKKPSACIQCRKCEQVCPQGIKISEVLADLNKRIKNSPWL